ncbi:MAG: N-6 DNA methylase [Bacteroidetes bacterium]|nr:N-6 DNA methylase [Bacteroidota bacterium]
MKPEIKNYISEINEQYITGIAREHSYRPALQNLLSTILPKHTITNEPSRINCGAPDFIIAYSNIPIAYIECKDVNDGDLDGTLQHKEQFNRYKDSLDNIIFTDYLDFHYYENGKFIDSVRIGEIKGGKIVPIANNEILFLQIIERLAKASPQKITSSRRLAKIMANKAKLMADIIEKTLELDVDAATELSNQYETFKTVLIHDLTQKSFADIFSQTICYGMFAARLHDTTPEDFSRMEAARLIPETNPFLRNLFQSIATFGLDKRIEWIVDDLAEVFRVTDMSSIMENFGSNTQQTDPTMHFYEEFLSEYDPTTKKGCGVYYTPQPVVEFIVRAVDDILKNKFGISMGLADSSKVMLDRAIDGTKNAKSKDNKMHQLIEYHKVQILDPATGTGTFPAQVIRQVYDNLSANGMAGGWRDYVKEHLIPRLNAFEFMMSPYAIAHIKLNWILNQIDGMSDTKGFDKRLNVFLTNSLENYNLTLGTLFGQWLSTEAQEADRVKRDTPVMIMLGNPPYSAISNNNSKWITDLIKDYRKEPNSSIPLKEKKNYLNDDYVKFIRLGQYFIDKNKEGIIAYINNNNFLDSITSRGMRWSLLKSFDEIYVINLHGAMKDKTLDGSKDENVFDITVGTSINIFIKTGKKQSKDIAEVKYLDVYGLRNDKYDFLKSHRLAELNFQTVLPKHPSYFFVPKDTTNENVYNQGFGIVELMADNTSGIVTSRDSLVINKNKDELLKKIKIFTDISLSDDDVRSLFFSNMKDGKYLPGDSSEFSLSEARKKIRNNNHQDFIREITYRPFDTQYIYYSKDMVDRGHEQIFCNTPKNGLMLILSRQAVADNWSHILATTYVCDNRTFYSRKGITKVCPLYFIKKKYSTSGDEIIPNLNQIIWDKINDIIGEKTSPEQIFDYMYGVLHSPSYRTAFKDFLKIDFPRIPYPTDKIEFERIQKIGTQLRELHLLVSVPSMPDIAQYNISGSNEVVNAKYRDNNVYINQTQCFENVPETAWNFYIGGYQPAQKWLKDRMKNILSFDDILHYRKIIAVLIETDRLMNELG